MAITYGTEVRSSSGNGMRLGYEFSQSPAVVGTGTSSVVVTLKIYLWTRYSATDSSNSYSVAGDFSATGSASISHGGSGGTTLIRTLTRTVATSYAAAVKSAFSASITGINAIPGTAKVAGTATTSQRPASQPTPISSATAARVTDARQQLTWVNNPAPGTPYETVTVERWDNVAATWYLIATVAGSSQAYTDLSTIANRRYQYRVRPRNGTVNAATYTTTNYLTTLQSAPSAVKAARTASNILVEWKNNATVPFAVEVWHATNGVWDATVLAYLTGAPTSWTHISPDTGTSHTYALKAVSDEPRLYSARGASSSVVPAMAPPAAPTALAPATGAFDASGAQTFTWRHNSIDTTVQSAYELQHRIAGGAWTTTGKVTSGTSARAIAAGTFTNGAVLEWQVRTWGSAAGASPWSQSALVTLSARPTATITSPGTTALSSRLDLEWAYYDQEGTTQTAYRTSLEASSGDVLWAFEGDGQGTFYRFPTALQDGATYTVRLAVRDGAGGWSDDATRTFTVDFADPPTAEVTARWNLDLGAVTLEIKHPEPGANQVPAVSAEAWRSANGADWVPIAKGLDPNTTVTDFIPPLNTVCYYKIVTLSEIPSAIESAPVAVTTDSQGWVFVNAGPGFGRIVKIRDNAQVGYVPKRLKALNHYAGRDFPVETTGEQRDLGISLSARIGGGSSTRAEWEDMSMEPAPLCYRDPERREFVSFTDISFGYRQVFQEATMGFDKVDYDE